MPAARAQEEALILDNRNEKADYFRLQLHLPRIAAAVQPGQFVDLLLPNSPHLLLRRPFSVFDSEPDEERLAVIFKCVGAGTRILSDLAVGSHIDVLGPLGRGFPLPAADARPAIVAGGYGAAATHLLAKRSPVPGIVMLGGRKAQDILLVNEFRATGWDLRIATEDGSLGEKGLVTELLAPALAAGEIDRVYACGPNAMLAAVARLCLAQGIDPWVSVDLPMCCGVGACFTCVVKVKADNPEGWEYVRSCCQGPVFRAGQLFWDSLAQH